MTSSNSLVPTPGTTRHVSWCKTVLANISNICALTPIDGEGGFLPSTVLGRSLSSTVLGVRLANTLLGVQGMMMDILSKIKDVLQGEQNDAQLDQYLTEVRESLASSNRQFISYTALIIASLVTYHLVVYEGSTGPSINSIPINATLFRRVFLVFPAALIAAVACVGYLRKAQRDVFDYLTISRYRVLGKTGLHELRLPADYILGLFLLKTEGGLVGKVVSHIVALLAIAALVFVPIAYVVTEAITNVRVHGLNDLLCLVASGASIVLCISALLIVLIAIQIKSE